MKKLITLLILFVGMVSTVSATKRVWVNLTQTNSEWTKDGAKTAIHYAPMSWETHTLMTEKYCYGEKWCYYDVADNVNTIVFKRCSNDGTAYWNWQSVDISWNNTDDLYLKLTSGDQIGYTTLSTPEWNYIIMRNNYISGESGAWSNVENNTNKDGDVFSYELTKAQIDSKSYLKSQGLRFRFHHGDKVKLDDYGTDKGDDKYPEIAPKVGGGVAAPFDTDITEYYQDVNSGNYWQVTLPNFDYEKLVFVADYSSRSWVIRVYAYITKTITDGYKYATLGCSVPLEIVEANGVSAYPLTANASTGKITKGAAITTIPANEGALLENKTGSDQTIRAKVLASAASSAANQLHAFLGGSSRLTQPDDGNTYYILGVQNEHVGFYMVNTDSGNKMGANTAYLSVATGGGSAREFFAFDDDETTGIESMKASQKMNGEFFNLAGQRVAQPTKGLYIVNGKKVIMK